MSEIRRGIAIVHYNRAKHIKKVVEGVLDTCPRDINRIVVFIKIQRLKVLPAHKLMFVYCCLVSNFQYSEGFIILIP